MVCMKLNSKGIRSVKLVVVGRIEMAMYKVKYDNYILHKRIDQLRFCLDIDTSFEDEESHNTELNEHPSD